MSDGLKESERQAIREALAQFPAVEKAVLFGSRAMGTFSPASDIDLALYGDTLTLRDESRIAAKLEDLVLPVKVDLLRYCAIASKDLLAHIARHGKLFFARGGKVEGGAGVRREIAIGDAFDVSPYRSIKRGQVTPFIPMDALPSHARSVSRIEEREFPGSGTKFQNGDTLIARITPCLENGKTAFVTGLSEGVVAHGSTEYIVLAGKRDQSDGLFAYYLARSPDFRRYAIGHMEGTSGRQRVPSSAVEKYVISLPPLPEQRAIAHILGTLDDKIELNRRMNETLEAMARALFKSWFVDFDPVRAKAEGRWRKGQSLHGLPADLYDFFPDSLEDSELGEIPKGWKICGLDEIATFLNGLALQKYPPGEGVTLPVIKIAQLRRGDAEGADRCNAELPSEYVVGDGDVMFSWSGSLECILWAGGEGALNQHLFKVTSDRFPKWFYYLCIHQHLPAFRHIAESKATTMGHIQRHHLTEAKVVVANADALQAADKIVAPLIEQVTQRQVESRTLTVLRDTLLPKLITGELRVKDDETFIEGAV